ncbi:MAG: glutamine--tRNA ligase/YqeY domain fusion protein [Bacteroidia bacterium]|nr:glutamine--tRNA ligase/YqeY domain fusion protein [Bacteroidia bacterium]
MAIEKGEVVPGENAAGVVKNFLEEVIEKDLESGRNGGRVLTRFPPEPNGYLHIGHAKSICINFGLAQRYGGETNLRFDDTNPTKEDVEYVDSIKEDIRWLGFRWARERYASDYFEQLYEWACKLIREGLAYVDDQTQEQLRDTRGTVTVPGANSPWRDRSVEENLDLFTRMRKGEFPDGSRVLRAKIDMGHPNMLMRDPILYRIIHATHHRTGDKWCIYPMYDFAHGQSDSIEGVTHSICTLEFDVHRPLYDWFIEKLGIFPSHQYEFARLNLTYTLMSKRRLLELVQTGVVSGWDDPRMPTICGLRRRGYTADAIKRFAEAVGVAKRDNVIDLSLLEFYLREDLNVKAQRRMAVLYPLKVVIENYPEGQEEWLDAINNPERIEDGVRKIPFSRELFIERDDFMQDPPKKFFRLAPGREVRLRYAYFITCREAVMDERGEVVELRCTYDPATKGGDAPDGRKVKSTIHWVSAPHAVKGKARLFDRLFMKSDPNEVEEGKTWKDNLNPESKLEVEIAMEPSLLEARVGEPLQFERLGYFAVDKDSSGKEMVFNRSVTLKDAWAKVSEQGR